MISVVRYHPWITALAMVDVAGTKKGASEPGNCHKIVQLNAKAETKVTLIYLMF
jgi:hypothetical protein